MAEPPIIDGPGEAGDTSNAKRDGQTFTAYLNGNA